MATMDTNYLPSGALQTVTSGSAGAGGAGGGGLLEALLPMLQASMGRKDRMAAMAEEEMKQAAIDRKRARVAQRAPASDAVNLGGDAGARVPVRTASLGGGGKYVDGMAAQLAAQRAAMQSEQMMMDRLPAPQRMVHGAGIISGKTLDPMAMNAAQRQSYLPSSSQEGPSESARNRDREAITDENAAGRKERAGNRSDMDFWMRQSRADALGRRF